MKIKKSQLKRIIKEELMNILMEDDVRDLGTRPIDFSQYFPPDDEIHVEPDLQGLTPAEYWGAEDVEENEGEGFPGPGGEIGYFI